MVGKRSLPTKGLSKDFEDDGKDEEAGVVKRPRALRFRDMANIAVEDQRMQEIKKNLKEGIDHDSWEDFRKTDEEVRTTCR